MNVGNLKAVFGCAIGQVGMRIRVWAKGGTTLVLAKVGEVDVALHRVDTAARTENPVLVRLVVEIEEGIGEHTVIIEGHRIVPSCHQQACARDALIEKVALTTIFENVPLRGVDMRTDIVAVLRRTGADTQERVVAIFRDFYRIIGNVQDFVLVNRGEVVGRVITAHHIPIACR